MLILFHSPKSRSTRIIRLLHELDIVDKVQIRLVQVARQDGSGAADPANPHPEGKVPVLEHDGCLITESNAIILYLTDLFPSALSAQIGDADRGRYLSWLSYYGNVIEPVLIHAFAGLEHPALQTTFRGMPELGERLSSALAENDYLMGDRFSAADLLISSPFLWFRDMLPDDPALKDWLERCESRDAVRLADEFDEQHSKS